MDQTSDKKPKTDNFLISNPKDINEISNEVVKAMESFGWEGYLNSTRYIVNEILYNAHKHGNSGDYNKHIRFEYIISETKLQFFIKDECEQEIDTLGKLINKGVKSKSANKEELEEIFKDLVSKRRKHNKRPNGGVGAFSVGCFGDNIENYYDNGNITIIEKYKRKNN